MVQMVGGNSRKYDKMSEEKYNEIAGKYGASYLVVPANRKLGMEKVYTNKGYGVYKLRQSTTLTTP